jgi:hypothetical protein
MLTQEEWHAFVHGLFEVVPPWRPRLDIQAAVDAVIAGEEHYYQAGRGVGFVSLILLFSLVIKWLA